MSKILIVLSAILVISRICAGNAGSETTLRGDCKESIEEVRTYIDDVFNAIPSWMQTEEVLEIFEEIRKEVDKVAQVRTIKNEAVAHSYMTPYGQTIKCNDGIAKHLVQVCRATGISFKSAVKDDDTAWYLFT